MNEKEDVSGGMGRREKENFGDGMQGSENKHFRGGIMRGTKINILTVECKRANVKTLAVKW